MAGTGQNQQKQQTQQDQQKTVKYLYFHCNNHITNHTQNSTVQTTKILTSSPVCTSTSHQKSMMTSPISPWQHTSTIAGDNDDSLVCDDANLTSMTQQLPSLSINNDSTTLAQQPYENNGHFFVKKTFHKPTYCHHCVEMLWGLIGQGYYCEGNLTKMI